jgi:hypothetical protein
MATLKNKFVNRMFRKIGGLVWDLTTGAVGVRDENGIYSLSTEGSTPQVVVNPIGQLGFELPFAYAFATKLDDVTVGDIIVGDSKILGFVVEKHDASLVLLDKNGMTKRYTPPKVALFDVGSSVLVVRNLMNMLGSNGLAGLQGNLLPLLALAGDDESGLEDILPMLLLSQQGGEASVNGLQSILPMLLLSKKGGDIDPMMLMAMSGGLGGAGGLQGMLPFLLMSKKGGDIDPMMLMAMSGGFGGDASAGGMNPLVLMSLLGKDLGSEEPVSLAPTFSTPPLTRV